MKLIIMLLVSCSCMSKVVEQIPFDSKVWNSSQRCKPLKRSKQRLGMEEAIFRLFKGKSKKEVSKILGSPDIENGKKLNFAYCLGVSYGMTMNWLNLNFENDSLKGFQVILKD